LEYYLIHTDQPTEYLLIGTVSFNSFWPDQGLKALMNIVENSPEQLTNIEIKTNTGKIFTISEFLERIKTLKVRSNG
jgi:hypothetical protein